jgi:hypothetical protein
VSLRDELTDPWGVLVAAVSGGLAWAVLDGPVGVITGIGVGAAVYGTRVTLGALSSRERAADDVVADDAPELPAPRRGSPANLLLRRGASAAEYLTTLIRQQPGGWVGDHLSRVEVETREALTSLRRVAGRLDLLDTALERIDIEALHDQRRELATDDASSTPGLRLERARAIAAVDAQLAAHARLQTARSTLSTRMQTAVLGLEGVVTRVHEVLAAAEGASRPGSADTAIDTMQGDLDALRDGLAEAEAIAGDDWGTAYGL